MKNWKFFAILIVAILVTYVISSRMMYDPCDQLYYNAKAGFDNAPNWVTVSGGGCPFAVTLTRIDQTPLCAIQLPSGVEPTRTGKR